MARKLREATIALRLEQRYTKQQILSAYLNAVYFGDGYYGVEAASRGYFGKPAAGLEPHEAALLAALVRSPGAYSPSLFPQRALKRRNLVLRLMHDTGRLPDAEYHAAIDRPLLAARLSGVVTASQQCGKYYEEEVRRQLVARLKAPRDHVLTRRQQLLARAVGESVHAHGCELVVGGAELGARVGPAMLAAQPFAVEQMRARQVHAHLASFEAVERLAIVPLSGHIWAQERA